MPSSFTHALINMTRYWPSLYTCRADMLNQLFCVIGNGYEWEDGRLTDGVKTKQERERRFYRIQESTLQRNREFKSSAEAFAAEHGLAKPQLHLQNDRIRPWNQIERVLRDRRPRHVIRNARQRKDLKYRQIMAQVPGYKQPASHSMFYHIGKHSRCVTVPDDIRPDWLAGVRECMAMVIAWDADYPKQVAAAKAVLADLERRFGPPPQ